MLRVSCPWLRFICVMLWGRSGVYRYNVLDAVNPMKDVVNFVFSPQGTGRSSGPPPGGARERRGCPTAPAASSSEAPQSS